MIAGSIGAPRWAVLDHCLERLDRQATALSMSAWLYEAWPEEHEHDEVRDKLWRAWRQSGDEVLQAAAWTTRAAQTATLMAAAHGHVLSPRARGYSSAALLWIWRVCSGRRLGIEAATFELVDGIEAPERWTATPPELASANQVSTVRFELLAGALEVTSVPVHDAGRWIARASIRSGYNFITWTGEGLLEAAREGS